MFQYLIVLEILSFSVLVDREGGSFIALEILRTVVMDKESIAAEVEPEIKQQLRVAAAQEGISMSAYIRKAVRNQLEEDRSGNGARPATTVN